MINHIFSISRFFLHFTERGLNIRPEIKQGQTVHTLQIYIYIHFYFCVWCVPNVCRSAFAKSSFFNIVQKFRQKWTPHTIFTIFWYPTPKDNTVLSLPTHHMYFFFIMFVGVPELFKKMKKLFQPGFVKRFFWLKQKNYFVLGVPKVLYI